jgi:RNA polymerase sigma-70 factor (ECF subfamily)
MNTSEDRFRYLFDAERSVVYGIATSYGIPYDEIEDIMMEAFTRFLETYPMTKSDGEIRSLIAKMTVNLCRDYYRKNGKHPIDYCEPEKLETEILSGVKHYANSTEDVVMEHILERDILEGMKSLKPIHYQMFVLHGLEDRSTAEISEMLGITKENCRERWHRAKAEVTAYLEKHSGIFIQKQQKKKQSPARKTSEKDEELGWE